MADPQAYLKKWLDEQLAMAGPESVHGLAARLGKDADAIRRMRNWGGPHQNPRTEQRRIDAHMIPLMVAYFGSVPPGFDFSQYKPAAMRFGPVQIAAGTLDWGGHA